VSGQTAIIAPPTHNNAFASSETWLLKGHILPRHVSDDSHEQKVSQYYLTTATSQVYHNTW
jgi:hypothetical protein